MKLARNIDDEPSQGSKRLSAEPVLQRKSLTEQILEILERRIVAGELVPGTKLSEEAIAAEFGTSRSPVRDVLASLEREGFADRVGLRDRRVATPTKKFVVDTYETWIILEVNRTYISSKHATRDDHKRIQSALESMRNALKSERSKEYSELSRAFPDLLHNRCDNLQLVSVLMDFEKYRQWLSSLYLSDERPSLMMLEEHAEIAKAYIAKDLAELTKSISKHVTKQRDQVLRAIAANETSPAP